MARRSLSRIYKRQGKSFRYDFDNSLIQLVSKATPQDIDDEKEWVEQYGESLLNIGSDGYMVINSAGLRPEHWLDRESRNEYLDGWIGEMEEELRYEMMYM